MKATPFSLLLLAPLASNAVRLELAPEPGTQRSRRLVTRQATEFESFRVWMGGSEVPREYLPKLEIRSTEERRLVTTDRYERVADGRLEQLSRHYDEVFASREEVSSMSGPTGVDESELAAEATSELEGRALRFAREPGDGELRARFADDEGEGPLPVPPRVDLDMTMLLPDGEVAPGDAWDVPAAELRWLLALGDDLDLEWEGDPSPLGEPLAEAFDGELEVLFESFVERDGRRLARLEIAGELRVDRRYETDLERVPVADGDAIERQESEYEVEGELLWDLDAGLPARFEWSGSGVLTDTLTKLDPSPGMEFETISSLRVEFESSARWSASE